mgnify:CR=1 FL=1
MTATPAPDTTPGAPDDRLRDRLAIVLDGEYGSDAALLDALLPVVAAEVEARVHAAAAQKAAEELRAAATDARAMHDPPAADCVEWADWLNARAAALTQPDGQQP